MHLKTKAFDFDVKLFEEGKGRFSGYASVFGAVDLANEVVEKGAFAKSLEDLASKGRAVPVLWQHQPENPIGSWEALKEDDIGLAGEGALWLDDAPHAKLAYQGLKTKSITGLSIGYIVKRDSIDKKSRVRVLHEIDLVEVSIVTNPCLGIARVSAVKNALESGDLPNLRDFEKFLREAGGFSKSQAAAITNGGLSKLLQSESVSETEQLIKSITDFRPSWS